MFEYSFCARSPHVAYAAWSSSKARSFSTACLLTTSCCRKVPLSQSSSWRIILTDQRRSMRGLSLDLLQNFECDLLNSPSTPADLSPTLMKIKVMKTPHGAKTKAIGTNSPWKHKWTHFFSLCNIQFFAKDKIKCHSIFLIVHPHKHKQINLCEPPVNNKYY